MKYIRVSGTIIYLLLSLCSGCSLLSSGTWEDDADNWKRAFQSIQPDDVVVLHSWYWRSPHWTYEFEYFFEIECNAALTEQLFTENKLIQLDSEDAVIAKDNFFNDPPEWFAPKAVDEYEIWVFEDQPERNFRVLIDKETCTLFLAEYLV